MVAEVSTLADVHYFATLTMLQEAHHMSVACFDTPQATRQQSMRSYLPSPKSALMVSYITTLLIQSI